MIKIRGLGLVTQYLIESIWMVALSSVERKTKLKTYILWSKILQYKTTAYFWIATSVSKSYQKQQFLWKKMRFSTIKIFETIVIHWTEFSLGCY